MPRVRIRSHKEVIKFLEFCDGKPHMQELADEIKRQWYWLTLHHDLDEDPAEYLLHELALAKTHNDHIKEIAAKFLLSM